MAEKSGFFNSSGGDRVYDATDFAAYFGDLVSNGIFFQAASNLAVSAAGGMNVLVQPGSGWVNGYHYRNTTPLELVVSTANGVNPRIDRVVLRWDNVGRSVNLAIKTGVPLGVPVPPDLTRTADVWELGLADILVARGAVSIGAEAVTDTRLNTAMCGLVNSLVLAVYE